VEWLDEGICNLYFTDVRGAVSESIVLSLPFAKPVTFGEVARNFSEDVVTVGFKYEDQVIKKSTMVTCRYWDPAKPIQVFKNDALQVVIPEFPR